MHEVLFNRLGSLSLPRKSVDGLTDRPDMTLDVYRGRKTTKQQATLFLHVSENKREIEIAILCTGVKVKFVGRSPVVVTWHQKLFSDSQRPLIVAIVKINQPTSYLLTGRINGEPIKAPQKKINQIQNIATWPTERLFNATPESDVSFTVEIKIAALA